MVGISKHRSGVFTGSVPQLFVRGDPLEMVFDDVGVAARAAELEVGAGPSVLEAVAGVAVEGVAPTGVEHGLGELPQLRPQFLELVGSADTDFDDAAGRADLLHPDDYGPSQIFGAERRAARSNGIVWPSVRCPGGHCIGAFWPDVVPIPRPAGRYAYHWNGEAVDFVKKLETGEVMTVS